MPDPIGGSTEDGLWKGDPVFRAQFQSFSAARGTSLLHPVNATFRPSDRDFLSGVDLSGLRVTLALGPAVESNLPGMTGSKCDIFPPLYLIQIASVLRAYHAQVAIKDHCVGKNFTPKERQALGDVKRLQAALAGRRDVKLDALLDKWIGKLELEDTGILCLSAHVSADPLTFVLLKRRLKLQGRSLPMIVGGYWNSPLFRHAWSREIDYLVNGEGEIPLTLLCDALHHGKPPGLVPGVTVFEDQTKSFRTSELTHSMDALPVPDLEGFDLDAYSYRTYTCWDGVVIPYRFIVGCPSNCAYCNLDHKKRFKCRRPELVVRDLLSLEDRFGVSRFFFLNAAFNIGRAYEAELLARMIQAKRRWRWSDCCRPQGITEKTLVDMRRAGCDWLNWGLDTSSDRLGRLYQRNIRREDFTRVLEMSKRAGIRNSINVIIGLPHETKKDVDDLLSYLEAHDDLIQHVFVHQYNFIPHSDMGTAPERFGLRLGPGGWGVDEIDGLTWAERQRFGGTMATRVRKFAYSHAKSRRQYSSQFEA
ncbi:MAG: radical SAM protein [Elusimicrobia bacterium]|nr:radical SAM protein [Elusimicrobiota bacterium]